MEYTTWKKNSPLLYRQLQTSSLLWPSLTLDWLPDIQLQRDTSLYHQHRILLSTYSNGLNSHESLIFTNSNIVDLSSESCTKLENFDYLQTNDEFIYSLPLPHLTNTKELTQLSQEQSQLQGEPDLQPPASLSPHPPTSPSSSAHPASSLDQHSTAKVNNSLALLQKIPHPGDINRIKHCPQNPDLIAISSDSGLVRIYDRTRKPNNYNESDFTSKDIETSDILLKFHTSESWTLDWNQHKDYTIATASNDGSIAVWNLDRQFKAPPKQKFSTLNSNINYSTCTLESPQLIIPAHDYGVNEVRWIPDHHSLLLSAGEDSSCKLWDIRNPSKDQLVLQIRTDTDDALNTIDINPNNTFSLISGSSSGSLFHLDIRNSKIVSKNSATHKDSITSSKFSPHLQNTFATSSTDGTVVIWKDTDPVFVHKGHLLPVNDVVWCPSTSGLLASCSNDNSVHVWEPII